MYLNRPEDEDRNMAESWKYDADGMLVFVGFRAYNIENADRFALCRRCSIAPSVMFGHCRERLISTLSIHRPQMNTTYQ
jgi:hypothetical protein